MASEDECLRRFGRHCRFFYDSSLILRPSSASLSSLQGEEKKADDNNLACTSEMKEKRDDGKIALEALDRIIAIRSILESIARQQPGDQDIGAGLQSSIDSMRQEHSSVVESHRDVLDDCGLLHLDRFMDDGSNEMSRCQSLLQKYAQVRDISRRRSHEVAMLHRQNTLIEIIRDTSRLADALDASNPSAAPRLTQLKHVQRTISVVQTFVNKYQSNIGAHPFLAGLYRIIDVQLNPESGSRRRNKDPSRIVRWEFRGSVLTEACRSCQNNQNVEDELAYAREAIEVLFSCLTWIRSIDVEGGEWIVPIDDHDLGLDDILQSSGNQSNTSATAKENAEPLLSFEVDKHISDANLRRILSILPDPKRLDARATGSVEMMHASVDDSKDENCEGRDGMNIVSRKNVDGHEDEKWPWFARLEFCTVL